MEYLAFTRLALLPAGRSKFFSFFLFGQRAKLKEKKGDQTIKNKK